MTNSRMTNDESNYNDQCTNDQTTKSITVSSLNHWTFGHSDIDSFPARRDHLSFVIPPLFFHPKRRRNVAVFHFGILQFVNHLGIDLDFSAAYVG